MQWISEVTASYLGRAGTGGGSPNKVQKRVKETTGEKRRRLKVAVVRRNKIPRVGQTIHDAGESHPHLLPRSQAPPPESRVTSHRHLLRLADTLGCHLDLVTWRSHSFNPYERLLSKFQTTKIKIFYYSVRFRHLGFIQFYDILK